MPYPQASAALIEGLASIAGLTLDASALRTSAEEARQRVDDLVTNNPDHTTMVEQLEQAADEIEGVLTRTKSYQAGTNWPPNWSDSFCGEANLSRMSVGTW